MSNDSRLNDLETRLSFQEDLLQSLNTLCYSLDQRVQLVERKNQQLIDHIKELAGQAEGDMGEPSRPPHF